MQTTNDATEQTRAQFGTVTTECYTARTEMQGLRNRVVAFECTRREVNISISRLRGDIRAMDRHRAELHRDRQTVGIRAWFAVRCAIRTIVRTVWDRAQQMVAQLDQHMQNIVAGREVEDLTDNPAFEEYEEDCPLQLPRSSVNVLAHERGAFRRTLDRDPFEDISTGVQPDGAVATFGTNGGDDGDDERSSVMHISWFDGSNCRCRILIKSYVFFVFELSLN